MGPVRVLLAATVAVLGVSSGFAATTCTAEPFSILPTDYGLDVCVGNNLGDFLDVLATASGDGCSLTDLLAIPDSPSLTNLLTLVQQFVAAPDKISATFYQHMKATSAAQIDALCFDLNIVLSPCARTLIPGLLAIVQKDLTCCSQISDLLDLANLAVPATVNMNAFLLNDVLNGVNSFLCSKRDNVQTCGASLYSQLTTKFTETQFSVVDSFLAPFFTTTSGHECNAMNGLDYLDSASLTAARTINYGCCAHQMRPLFETVQNAFSYLLGHTIDDFLNGIVDFANTTTKFVNAVPGTKSCVFASKCANPSYLVPAFQRTITPGTNRPGKNDVVDTTCTKAPKCDAKGTCSDVCQKGSVVVSPWLNQTLAFERKLAASRPICFAQLPATHNSAITLADGYGNRDQLFNLNLNPNKPYSFLKTNNHALSLTDQLRLGVRWLEVDAHFFLDDLHTAHCGNLGSASIEALFGALNAKLRKYGSIVWGPELLGCFPSLSGIRPDEQGTTRETLREIRTWLDRPENQKEFVFLYLDTGSELARLNKIGDLNTVVTDVFGDLLVPISAFNAMAANKWTNSTTIQEFVDRNQRVFVLANANTGLAYRLGDFCNGHKVLDTKFINDQPDAATRVLGGVKLYSNDYFVRSYQSVLRYISLGEAGTISQELPVTLEPNNIPNFVRWNLNLVAPEQLDGAKIKAQVWSWAENEPSTTVVDGAVFVNPTGRWLASTTAAKTWKACWNSMTLKWNIVAFAAACAPGFTYTAPKDAYQNTMLRAEIAAQKITIPVAINGSF